MGKLLRINPELHFPWGTAFQVHDEFNGPRRGTWYYRSPFSGQLRGPYENRDAAEFYMEKEEDGA